MIAFLRYRNPSEAAQHLGVSTKALRLYEERGLLVPLRTAAGWRAYGPDQMVRAAEIVSLRALGFSLAQVAQALSSDVQGLEPALTRHQARLEAQLRHMTATLDKVRTLRGDIARGNASTAGKLPGFANPVAKPIIAFDLPWPWGGEWFELGDVRPITYITGPLGSGKTKLAQRLAEALPHAAWLGLDRLADGGATAQGRLAADAVLGARVEQALAWLIEHGASPSAALIALLVDFEAEAPGALVIDMVEQNLDGATQEAVIAYLRRRGSAGRPLVLLTRSCAVLNLAAVGAEEMIIFCPANHGPPMCVAPNPGAAGYEAVSTCLAQPDVRARTEGMIAWRPRLSLTGPARLPGHSN